VDLIAFQALDLAIAADVVTAVTGALIDAEVRLYQNDVTPSAGMVLADFDVATYDGYADEAVTWLAPSVADDGTVEIVGTVGEFRPTGAVTPNTIFGALLLDGTGALIMAGRFDGAPLPMGSVLDSLLVTPRWRAPSSGLMSVVS